MIKYSEDELKCVLKIVHVNIVSNYSVKDMVSDSDAIACIASEYRQKVLEMLKTLRLSLPGSPSLFSDEKYCYSKDSIESLLKAAYLDVSNNCSLEGISSDFGIVLCTASAFQDNVLKAIEDLKIKNPDQVVGDESSMIEDMTTAEIIGYVQLYFRITGTTKVWHFAFDGDFANPLTREVLEDIKNSIKISYDHIEPVQYIDFCTKEEYEEATKDSKTFRKSIGEPFTPEEGQYLKKFLTTVYPKDNTKH